MRRLIFIYLTLLVIITQPVLYAQIIFDGHIKNNSLAINIDETMAAVAKSDSDNIIIYDLKNNTIFTVLANFVSPRNMIFSPDGERLYISDSSMGGVVVLETENFFPLDFYPVGYGAFGSALTSNGHYLYINNQAVDIVTVIDTTQTTAPIIIKGTQQLHFANPRQGIKISPDGKHVFVTNFVSDEIIIIDVASHEVIDNIAGFDQIRAISITQDNKTLYAANSGNNTIAVVDIVSRTIEQEIPVGKNPYGAALTPDGSKIYTGNRGDNSLSVIDTKTYQVIATINGFNEPRQAIAFSKDGSKAYVLNEDLSIAVVDTQKNEIIDTLRSDIKKAL